uniref:Major facilitator superfamily (MFS) profile domain-containing protein n=1 Tax=Alexandrium catenella TaxID=2925 RepID=A0A7S1Q754_ALECA
MAQLLQGEAQSLPSTWQILLSLGHLIPYVCFTAVANGVLGPIFPYIGLNWFSQRYTDMKPEDIHCEQNMELPYCRMAIFDTTHLMMVMSIACPIVQFLMLPVVGVLSDAIGRWKLVLVYHVVSTSVFLLILLVVFNNISLYWYYAFLPFTLNPLTGLSWGTVVYYAMVTDRVEHPAARSVGLGLLEASMAVFMLLGNVLGSFLTVRAALCTALGSALAGFVYMLLLLPETLPPEKRAREWAFRSLLPGVELPILWRTHALKLLTVIIACSGFLDAGFARVWPVYMQYTMNWTSRHSYLSSLLGNLSAIVALGVLFRALAQRMGDVGMLVLGRLLGIVAAVVVMMATQPWQVLTVTLFTTGPTAFALPAIAGLKSAIVGPEDQGAMQGALSTVFNVASSLGLLTFSALFDATNRPLAQRPGAGRARANQAVIWLGIVLAWPVLVMISRIPSALQSDGVHHKKPDLLEEAEDDRTQAAQQGKIGAAVDTYGSVA